MQQRKITYKMYPNKEQESLLDFNLGLHCRVSNTLLETAIEKYKTSKENFSFYDMCKEITTWRDQVPSLKKLNAQSLQITAKRLFLAYSAFFRRVKKGETPGFPRFKSQNRFSGFGFKTYGDGWKISTTRVNKNGKPTGGFLTLSGIGKIDIRGVGRFTGTPKTCEVFRKNNKWFLSVTYNVTDEAIKRENQGTKAMGFDWGVKNLLTICDSDKKTTVIDNPRWLKTKLENIRLLQHVISREEIKAKSLLGLKEEEPIPTGTKLPKTRKLKALYLQLGKIHSKIARQRKDFYHKLTTELVSKYHFIATEELNIKNMTKKAKKKENLENTGTFLPNGQARKTGLNRSILETAPSMFTQFLKTKAEEAAGKFSVCPTRKVKPTQRCNACGKIVKKDLKERIHNCSCGEVCDRDENAAKVVLRWDIEGEFWLGTSQEVQETPETAFKQVIA